MQVKHEPENRLARVLDVAPPQPYERGADGKRSWWRRALELFGTFRRKHGDVLTREDVAEYRKQKPEKSCPSPTPSGISDCVCRGWMTSPKAWLSTVMST
jgi:hypothetical protein